MAQNRNIKSAKKKIWRKNENAKMERKNKLYDTTDNESEGV